VRKLIIVAGSLAVFSAGWCFGQARRGNDGNSWHVLPPVAHTFYVMGFSEGYQDALMQGGSLALEHNTPEKASSFPPAERKNYQELLRWGKRIVPFFGGPPKTVGELEGALDTFYIDYRNTPVCLDEAILFSVASLAGNAATDQELEAARKKGGESGCK
jgi:hypothetical protein